MREGEIEREKRRENKEKEMKGKLKNEKEKDIYSGRMSKPVKPASERVSNVHLKYIILYAAGKLDTFSRLTG